jgi:hypothetical protein
MLSYTHGMGCYDAIAPGDLTGYACELVRRVVEAVELRSSDGS